MKVNDMIAGLIKARTDLKGDDIEVVIWDETPKKNLHLQSDPLNNQIIIDTLVIPEDEE